MRKPVQTEPTPAPDNHARGEKQANIENTEVLSRRCHAKGEAGAVSTANPSAGLVAASASIGLDDESSLNDAWLVERARHGDHTAFAVLVRRYERKLIRVLARLVRDPELARDLAQETLWRVYSRLERFDTARRFGPWLFRVAVNLGLDWLRRSRSEPSPPASIDRPHGDRPTSVRASRSGPENPDRAGPGGTVHPGTTAGLVSHGSGAPRSGRVFFV